jgi:glyoxylate reductase
LTSGARPCSAATRQQSKGVTDVKKVYVTRQLPQSALDRLDGEVEWDVNPHDRVLEREELLEAVKDVDGLLCLLTDDIDAELMDAADNLQIVANYAVGYNNIDVDAANERGIVVTNTPGVLRETTADLTWSLLMSIARRVVEGDEFMRNGNYVGWAPMLLLGSDVYGKTLGIVGMGNIGQAVARRAIGFEMDVLYSDVYELPPLAENLINAEKVELDELLERSDYVSLHVPLMDETRHMIGKRELELIGEDGYLINASRGPVIDEVAMVEALKNGTIAGAALDVYEDEPEMKPGLADCKNTVLLPHLGSASKETRTKMANLAVSNLLNFFAEGEEPPTPVNPEIMD